KKPLDPSILSCSLYGGEYYSIRINTNNLSRTLDNVRKSWATAFPGNPFEYFFLDEYFNKQYENERKFEKLFFVFAILAIVIGCLGLFGLSAYTASQRIKEIGIRKALGSSDRGIFILLSQEYVKLVALSTVLATPLVWWGMSKWIETFPYRINISAAVFVVAGLIVVVVALLT